MKTWDFWIDVGGTFTDCIARSPDGLLHTCKILSSGVFQGKADQSSTKERLIDPALKEFPENFFRGYRLTFLDDEGNSLESLPVSSSHDDYLLLERPADSLPGNIRYILSSGEEAPVICIRKILGLSTDEKLGNLNLRLGTTRGTNALLERNGAKLAFFVTEGFGDLIEIGNQARPKLFDLNIIKTRPLYTEVVEVRDRTALNEEKCLASLKAIKNKGLDAIAVCLINSYKNPAGEEGIARLAGEVGVSHVSLSSKLSPTIKALDRAETAVVDAYLSPVLNDYIQSIHQKIPSCGFKMMTSAGGLTDAHKFVGKDSLLSGPAGGVVGFAHVAKEAGFDKCIGFDMGGTSTDVSRFDGHYEYQFSLKKAGVRISSPMYAIETVAAGGGSICRFDGQKLIVGPESAGADPGPACYGKGGPLTVTDINLFNGKIDDKHFPFPLDAKAAERGLEEIADEIRKETGEALTLKEIAQGFTDVANLSMANAIKTISSAKGYDPADYALVSFGGAGSQHACRVAAALGMKTVLHHPFAGILSAFGIGMADVKRFAETSVLKPFTKESLKDLEETFRDFESKLKKEVAAEGVSFDRIEQPIRMLDLRYRGEDSVITVRGNNYEKFLSDFKRLHLQLYGHELSGRDVEIAACRVEVIGKTEKFSLPVLEKNDRKPKSRQTKICVFLGKDYETHLYERSDLSFGAEITGPAIIFEPFSTIIVDPGWKAKVTERGDLVLTCAECLGNVDRSTRKDPIRLELFSNQFTHIATQMGAVLQKSSLSTNVKERLDFSCAILDRKGNLVVNAPHIPVHLGAMGESVKSLMKDVDDIKPGDVYLSNDPRKGGSHLPDLTVMTPVFIEGGLCFFTASRAHHAEIGGAAPGSFYPFASSLKEEGVVFQNLRLVREGHFDEETLYRHLTEAPYPSRAPDENIADIRAQIAANHVGERDLKEMIATHSWDVVGSYMDYLCEIAEEKTRKAISQLADGCYRFDDCLDDGSPICVAIAIKGSEMEVDFSGSSPEHPGCLNANYSIVRSAVLYCLRCLIQEEIPLNSGVMAPVKLTIPRGLLNPEKDVAVSGGNVEVSQRVVDVVFGALGVAAASQGTMNNVVFGNDSFSYYETIGGGAGAGLNFNGASAVHTHMTNTRITDPEVMEQRYPVLIRRFQVRRGSGGSGRTSGGDGIIREIEFLEPVECTLLTQRRTKAPFGLKGGNPAEMGKNVLKRKSGTIEELSSLAQVAIEAGDILEIHTPGGGGYESQ